ncbi:MAG: C10 family peptidase [Bacteroidales bacterium]|nr:C10 family peptidase [Bacteroidales bacterium]
MKKSILTLATCLVALCTLAAPVERSTARQAAESFLTNTLHLKGATELADLSSQWNYRGMYLFTFGEGFVITSADDAARPILAYSLNGAFNPGRLSATQKALLDTYEAEIALARRDHLPSDPSWQKLLQGESLLKGAKDAPVAVGPLVATRWGQYAPYNGMCPSNVPSGCVATATSQVMRYWNYPAFGQGSHSYNCATFGNLSADFAHTLYDWANMPETGGSSTAERTALATLTFHVGVSVNMDYNYTQSGATTGGGDNCALEALRRYFHYNSTSISYHSKGSLSDNVWTDFLMAELQQLRPILYDGTAGAFGGHSFICDGYDSLRMLHFNLGEFGEGDGFYAIGAIVYMQYNLNGNNSAIIGIQPEYGIYASDTALTYHRQGGAQQVWVYASDTARHPWSASASQDWISLSDTSFATLGAITVTLTENTTGNERTGTVTLQQGNFTTRFTVKQAAFDEEDFCPLTVYMESTRNQAWSNGAHISFESPTGMVYATAAHSANGSSSSQTVSVAPANVVVKWNAGGPLDRYYNYTVVNANGDTLVNVNNAYYNGTDVLLQHPCTGVGIGHEVGETTSAVSVYPNPATDFLKVTSDATILNVTVTDASGRIVYRSPRTYIDTHTWPAGLYILQVLTEQGSAYQQVVIQ